ncbi:polysaccharide biosynthesis/export family protein [Shimia sp. MMG029]|uniref:polysaccharide biosynthesis/export family protein n=1 Tax=Shimia sp. MMG029 TaxID=3021978 RepID=UPI0022FE3A21|nr:polysaccharide biosynthesis/export family protein [Shimia sp. MMG029]MDA5559059.1 polysaccharide biosynthesis/export family protein [Shimia sp. MMG029]
MRNTIIACVLLNIISSCNEVLRRPELTVEERDSSAVQLDYTVKALPVSPANIKEANRSEFVTRVVLGGEDSAPVKRVSPSSAIGARSPRATEKPKYRIGAGDVIEIGRLNTIIDPNGLAQEQLSVSRLTVGDGGYVELVDAGKIYLKNRTLEEAQVAISTGFGARSADLATTVETTEFPVIEKAPYRIASADVLSLQFILVDTSLDGESSSSVVVTNSIVDESGLVNFLQIGNVEVGGLTLAQAQQRIGDAALQARAATDQVQLSITEFGSQTVVIAGDISVRSVPISIKINTYDKILSQTGLAISEKTDYLVELTRAGRRYSMLASTILSSSKRAKYRALDGDRIVIRKLSSVPDFRVSIEEFNAHNVSFINVAEDRHEILNLDQRGLDLRNVLVAADVNTSEIEDSLVRLVRQGTEFRFSAKELLVSSPGKKIWLFPDDSIIVEPLAYEKATAFLIGQVGNPTPFVIDRSTRSSLSDALFDGELFQRITADFTQIYLLRRSSGTNFTAYHFDLSDVENVTLAEYMELRPGDVVFVRTNPVNKFNDMIDVILGISNRSRNLSDAL